MRYLWTMDDEKWTRLSDKIRFEKPVREQVREQVREAPVYGVWSLSESLEIGASFLALEKENRTMDKTRLDSKDKM